jgi:hypothetical protein
MQDHHKEELSILIFMASIFAAAFISFGIQQKNHADCRMKAMELKYSAEQIAQICK